MEESIPEVKALREQLAASQAESAALTDKVKALEKDKQLLELNQAPAPGGSDVEALKEDNAALVLAHDTLKGKLAKVKAELAAADVDSLEDLKVQLATTKAALQDARRPQVARRRCRHRDSRHRGVADDPSQIVCA